ncbi:MAG: Malonyl CoA-acyl carrier protein transacylase [Stenotrophomonas maltophilia]|nr:MAG: Malonyl CoA-acyl carrier protein transacylase [Stenotrophomonas maltophilia]
MSTLWVFPGQGAQRPGMLDALPDAAPVRECLEQAGQVLGEDPRALHSEQALRDTRAVQLCLLIAGSAVARLLTEHVPAPAFVAGLSIGAYAAAVASGALEFADALRLVELRGRLMQQAYPEGYGMTALIGLDSVRVEALLAAVHTPTTPVYLANLNAENQIVIAGSDAAMATVAQRARQQGGVARRLAVSVPSHCPLLDAAAEHLAAAFANVPMRAPRLRYLSGSSARPIARPDALRDDLVYNLCRTINWRALVASAFERGVRLQLEVPPGNVLSGLARHAWPAGQALAFEGTRLDTLIALSAEEDLRTL